jgi:hypothetical protein
VDGEGHILCQQIKSGDREVTPAVCRACPIAQIDCRHLKATLDQQTRVPITVRWGNGKPVWDDPTRRSHAKLPARPKHPDLSSDVRARSGKHWLCLRDSWDATIVLQNRHVKERCSPFPWPAVPAPMACEPSTNC